MQAFSKQLTIIAPAKLNLHLKVLETRPDGFHNLESVFLALGFGDTLRFRPVNDKKTTDITMKWLNVEIPSESLPLENNIIFKALSLFREKTGINQGVKIKVEKCIPIGGGLGGGSSNAASTLLALNKLAGFPLTRDELVEMAGSLGSDVPFFIHETVAARVTGRGECIEPVEAPFRFFALVNPGFSSNTAAAFRLFDERRSMVTGAFSNDFLEVFREPEKSVYNTIISELRFLGADFASLSGTGSTCFGAFKKVAQAKKAARALRGKWKFVKWCEIARNLHCER